MQIGLIQAFVISILSSVVLAYEDLVATLQGRITHFGDYYYDLEHVACERGYLPQDPYLYAALSVKILSDQSSILNSGQCGRCIQLTGPMGSVVTTIVDVMMDDKATYQDVDLSERAFAAVSSKSGVDYGIRWDFVDCANPVPVPNPLPTEEETSTTTTTTDVATTTTTTTDVATTTTTTTDVATTTTTTTEVAEETTTTTTIPTEETTTTTTTIDAATTTTTTIVEADATPAATAVVAPASSATVSAIPVSVKKTVNVSGSVSLVASISTAILGFLVI
ncbi:UNVERIFIED_CONTAM: hypothetical protein HDU68_008835 [Siphonaria sp. JEL0065]|nr:hypothetical protein HDU68_008835 [Siphonaria sp. JEL0065]